MNLISTLIVLVVVTTLVTCAEQKAKSKQNKRNRAKKIRKLLNKQNLQDDPTDLNNIFRKYILFCTNQILCLVPRNTLSEIPDSSGYKHSCLKIYDKYEVIKVFKGILGL